MIESGTATPGIRVAERFRRNRKITITTRQTVSRRVNFTSLMEFLMSMERSELTPMLIDGGMAARNAGISFLMLSTTSTVLVPGWRFTARMMVRWWFHTALT